MQNKYWVQVVWLCFISCEAYLQFWGKLFLGFFICLSCTFWNWFFFFNIEISFAFLEVCKWIALFMENKLLLIIIFWCLLTLPVGSAIKADLSEDAYMPECINKDKQILKIWKASSDCTGDKFIYAILCHLCQSTPMACFFDFLQCSSFLYLKIVIVTSENLAIRGRFGQRTKFSYVSAFLLQCQSIMSASVQLRLCKLFE